jgi:hypothetical protein
LNVQFALAVWLIQIAISTASNPNNVENLIIGLRATDDVSLNGSHTVSHTTVASCNGVPFSLKSTSTSFLALSQAHPVLAIYIAWKSPNTAIDIRYDTKKFGSKNANANVRENITINIFRIHFCAYCVHILTTFFESSMSAVSLFRFKLFLINSTAR